MSSSPAEILDSVTAKPAREAWSDISAHLWTVFSARLPEGSTADNEIVRRDRSISEIENALSGACWDLWADYETCVSRTATALVNFWSSWQGGKAILILDGLSLRETPWLLQGAANRGFTLHAALAHGAELPCETTPFAKALGFSQRSALENNGAGSSHKFSGAYTEASGLNWKDSLGLIGNQESVFFWHHYPDDRIHDLSGPGEGLTKLARETREHLSSDDFWAFVERLATGRRLVITSDHGYAACGLFPDLSDKDQAEYMKKLFKSGRTATNDSENGSWIPPIDLRLATDHGSHRYVLGRRKWKSAGGYPTLHHGGLSLLEVFVPFIELSK